jgi:hypothetical protein
VSGALRISCDGLQGNRGKIEARVGDDWVDISHLCTRAELSIDVREINTARLTLLPTEISVMESVASTETLQQLAAIVDEARKRGRIPEKTA